MYKNILRKPFIVLFGAFLLSTGCSNGIKSSDINSKASSPSMLNSIEPDTVLTAPVGVHDCWPNTAGQCVTQLQAVSGADGTYSVVVDNLSVQIGAIGLMLYQDADNYIRFELYNNSQGYNANSYAIINDSGSMDFIGPEIQPGAQTILQVVKSGTSYTFNVSTNGGDSFVKAGQTTQVLTVNEAGPYVDNWSNEVQASFEPLQAPNLTLPAAASNVSATVPTSTSVELNWQNNSSNQTGFIIERRATNGGEPFAQVATVGGNTTSYTDSGLTHNWQYDYEVIAYNSVGNAAPSSPITIWVLAGQTATASLTSPTPSPTPVVVIPSAPTDLSASSPTSSSVLLSWTAASTATGYLIERKATNGTASFAQVAQVGNVTRYTDPNLTYTWQYTYEIIAINSAGDSSPSAPITIQVLDLSSSTSSSASSSSAPPAPTPTPVSTSSSSSSSSSASSSVPLDCANSSQQALCNYVEANMQMKSAPVTLSTACQNPSNPVAVNPSNFASVLGSLQSGQTAVFAAGTYNLTKSIPIVLGANYCGQASNPGAVVLVYDDFIMAGNGGNNTIEGITFNGGGIFIGQTNSISNPANNIFIQHNVIENSADYIQSSNASEGSAIILGAVSNVTISQNYIYNNQGGITQWNIADSILITDNMFSHTLGDDIGYEGTSSSSTGANMRIARNGFADSRRIVMEMFVPALSSLLIEDNAIVYEATFLYYSATAQHAAEGTYGMGISLPYAPNNTIIRNNWMFGPANSWNGADPQAAIETYGPMQIYDNVMQYWGQGLLEAAGGPSMSVTNNSMCNIVTAQAADGGYTGNAGTFTNNGCVKNAQGYGEP